MFKFYQELPSIYTIGDKQFKIDLSFGTVINMLHLINDESMTIEGRIKYALIFLFGKDDDTQAFFDRLDEDEKLAIFKDIYEQGISLPEVSGSEPQVDLLGNNVDSDAKYSLEYDSSAIYASFMQAYGIDLEKVRKTLHWQKFNALLSGLPSNTKFAEIMKYRNMDTSKITDPQEKAYYERMKATYALPDRFKDGI